MTGTSLRWCVPLALLEPAAMLAIAPVIDDLGYDQITVPDSAFFAEQVSADYPYTPDGKRFWAPDTPFVEPLMAIAAMSAITTRVRFVTNVLKTPLREPLLLAKQLSSLMCLANERVEVGVGLSWIPEEFAWTGTSMRTRGARLDEQIEILRLICGGGPQFVEHHGKHYDFGRLMVSPAPVAPLRIHIGGHSEPALDRAVRLGDGWISVNTSTEEILRIVGELAERRDRLGADARQSDVEPFDVIVLPIDIPATGAGLDRFRSLAEKITDAGMRPTFQVLPWWYYGGDPHAHAGRVAALERFAADVLDAD